MFKSVGLLCSAKIPVCVPGKEAHDAAGRLTLSCDAPGVCSRKYEGRVASAGRRHVQSLQKLFKESGTDACQPGELLCRCAASEASVP